MNTDELVVLLKAELFPAVVGDVMDRMGLTHQFLPPEIRPLRDDMVVAGPAHTVLEADCAGTRERAFGLMFDALDALEAGEVYLCTGASPAYACWGELMSTRAVHLGAAGAVTAGYSRDTKGIFRLGFPVFSWGRYAQDQGARGRVIDFGCPIEFANHVRAEPGDIVFGDLDGVLLIPRSRADEIVEAALEKVRGENRVRTAIEKGMSAREAWDTFGVM
jgi:regulator of RNase E activity RraA